MSEALELLKKAVAMFEEAENDEVEEIEEIADGCELSTLKPGEVFKIGEHDFIVLEQCDGETKVISKGLMASNKKFDDDTRNYAESSLKAFIEADIQPIIEAAVGAENLVSDIVDLTSVDMQKEFSAIWCKVRPITFEEARKYNDLLANEELEGWWWTCTPWSTAERGWDYSIAVVCSSGVFDFWDYNISLGVRPFCILKSNIFVSKGEA